MDPTNEVLAWLEVSRGGNGRVARGTGSRSTPRTRRAVGSVGAALALLNALRRLGLSAELIELTAERRT